MSKAVQLSAILAMRTEWPEADRLLAEQLASLRARLATEREKAETAPSTVRAGSGGKKANPVFAMIDRLAKQEASLTRRLGLGIKRNRSGRYETVSSPLEKRRKLWEAHGENCVANLLPGMWLHHVQTDGVAIPEDAAGWPNNPKTLPEVGKSHAVGNYYPASTSPSNREQT